MKRRKFMVVAGEFSGDIIGAELVRALQARFQSRSGKTSPTPDPDGSFAPYFFGAGGPHLAEAGVDLDIDLTAHAVIGLAETLRNLRRFRRIFARLNALAWQKRPDALLLIDFSGFNRRFAQAIRSQTQKCSGTFNNWNPRIVQYVSPQVWASREGRAHQVARDYDLLLSIIPFEKKWYAQRTPHLPVRYVGHPIVDRHRNQTQQVFSGNQPSVLLLPGSRKSEVQRHTALLVEAAHRIRRHRAVELHMVLPTQELADLARSCSPGVTDVVIQVGGLSERLARATVAIASTGTVTMECAYFGVPTVAIYVTSWSTYQIGKRVIKVPYLAMPNLLAEEQLFPELIQHAATPENIAREALELIQDDGRRTTVKNRLGDVIRALGPPGAAERAAEAVLQLLE